MQIQPSGPCPAKIMIVGEAPGSSEIRLGQPFVGAAGQELSRMLQEAGIMRSQCFITNVIRVAPPSDDASSFFAMKKSEITPKHGLIRDKMCLPPVWEGLELLKREIEMCRPNVIIALGNVALWALVGEWGITRWRGSEMLCDLDLALDYRPKVVTSLPPSMILRQWHLRQIMVTDLRRAKRESQSRELHSPDYSIVTRPDYATVIQHLELLQIIVNDRPLPLGVDIETRSGHTACIGLAWSLKEALCIPIMCVERQEGYWTLDEEAEITYRLYKLLTHKNCLVVGQNFLYDAQYISREMLFLPNLVHDTMLGHHACFSNMQKGLDFLSSMYCEHHKYWKDDGKTWDEKTGEDQLWFYNGEDAIRTLEVYHVELQNIKSMKLEEVNDFQQRLYWPVLDMMLKGVRVNQKLRAEYSITLLDEITKREAWLADTLGEALNIRSPKQMQELFYGSLGQKPIFSRKTKTVTCDDEALGRVADREPVLRPVVQKIQELRSLGVFLSTFVRAPLDTDGRMRCSFNIAGTETYRFSSSTNAFGTGLNLQNIPKGGENGSGLDLPNIRSLFIPDPGYTFFDIDLSSADLRVVVWEADEPEFKAMLRAGADPYTEIAKEFYHDPSITKKDHRRQKFKSFAHGTNYLGTPKGLADRLGLPVHEAEETQKWYFGRFPRIKKWQDDLKEQVIKRRMVENIFGYRCYFFDRIEGTIFNQAAAWIPQSTVACIINRAGVNLYNNQKWCELLLQVHDSLGGQFPTHLGDWAVEQILKESAIVLPYDDPVIIPVGIKTSTVSWGECE